MDCIFCAIAAGDIPCAKVYEDDDVLAFLDIQPLREGHALVIPKTHVQHLAEADPATAAAVMEAGRRLTIALGKVVGTSDHTIAINDGPAAGQEVPHLHLHIVPRKPGDGGGPVHALFPGTPSMDGEAMARLADRVWAQVSA